MRRTATMRVSKGEIPSPVGQSVVLESLIKSDFFGPGSSNWTLTG